MSSPLLPLCAVRLVLSRQAGAAERGRAAVVSVVKGLRFSWLVGLHLSLAALSASGFTETKRVYLSGRDAAAAVPWEFRVSDGARAGEWATLPVPSNWEMHGFGTLSYHNTTPSEQGEYRHRFTLPREWQGRRIRIVFDGVMTDTRVWVNGEPAGPLHQGGFYRFSYDITRLVRFDGENELEVGVDETSANEGVNKAERTGDYWNFGGIFRPVWLEAWPQQAIERVAIDARADGTLSVDTFVDGEGDAAQIELRVLDAVGREVMAAVRALAGAESIGVAEPAAGESGRKAPPTTGESRRKAAPTAEESRREGEGSAVDKSRHEAAPTVDESRHEAAPTVAPVQVNARVNSPALWSAETPNLYTADVRLLGSDGAVLHQLRERFGFRTFEIRKGDGFYLNGRRIVLQGANRHSFSATGGRALSEADHREDIRLMKEMNATAVRMSHYPPDERFLELCDEEGLYVLDELAGWQKSYDTTVGRALVEAMVKRDVNHPSILLWDNGNEGGWNTELDDEFARWDPQRRPVLHPWQVFSGVNTAHYRIYPQLPALVAGLETAWRYDPNDPGKRHEQPLIYLPTEFLHGLYDGGAGAGMEDYWTLMRSGKTFGGGFVWAWMDEGVLRPDTGEIDVRGNLAPDGILGPRREKEASFYTIKELWSPIAVVAPDARKVEKPFDGTVAIENRYSFTNTSACRFTWELRRMPAPGSSYERERVDESDSGSRLLAHARSYESGEQRVGSGVLASPDIAPGESGAMKLELPANWREADVLALRIADPRGRELWTYTWTLPGIARFGKLSDASTESVETSMGTRKVGTPLRDVRGSRVRGREPSLPDVTETSKALTVTAGELVARFDKITGAITELRRGEKKLSLGSGLRALGIPGDAAQGRRQATPLQENEPRSAAHATPTAIETRRDGADVVITCRYDRNGDEGVAAPTGLRSIEWRVRANGWIDCAYVYVGAPGSTFQGVGLDLPGAKVLGKTWVGDGPYRVWQNRRRGVSLGLWSNRYNDTITGWRGFVYPEFKGFFAGVRWLTLEMDVGLLTIVPKTEGLFVQVMKPDLPPAELQAKTAMTLPEADLGLLHVIPAIGTKFSTPEQGGPQGETPAAKETYSGAFSLRWE